MEGEREQDLDQGEESFKWNWKHMKSEFFWYLKYTSTGHILYRTIEVRQRAWDRERQRSHMKGDGDSSFILVLQFSITKSLSQESWPFFQPCCLVFIYKKHTWFEKEGFFKTYLECNSCFCDFFDKKRHDVGVTAALHKLLSPILVWYLFKKMTQTDLVPTTAPWTRRINEHFTSFFKNS